jgi:two-component system copper resistance phosphate regulon response regulator CusR
MRILVIHDEPITEQYLRTGLTTAGFVVDLADNGVDGQHLALTGGYDLIILDVMMPGISGWEVLRAVRQTLQTPVLILSARDDVEDRIKGLNLGADDFLVKPFVFAELLARIRALLRRAPLREEEHLRVADLEIDVLRRRVTRAG